MNVEDVVSIVQQELRKAVLRIVDESYHID